MENNSKSKYFVFIILILFALFIFYSPKIFVEKPYRTITPEGYPTGTTVELYTKIPPEFPKEVVLENKTLDYSGQLKTLEGKTKTTVSYISGQYILDLINLYVEGLPKVGWTVDNKSITPESSVLQVSKGEEKLIISITFIEDGRSMVTFQYEK